MKKIYIISLLGIIGVVSNSDAGWFSDLFSSKKETLSLDNSCNKAEIAKVCPDTILGNQTLINCLSDNINSLSKTCAKYVKQAVADGVDDIKQQVTDTKNDVSNTKKAISEEKESIVAEAVTTGQDIKSTAKDLKNTIKQTEKSFKGIL